MVRKFEDLRIWKDGMDLLDEVFDVAGNFPKSEIYGLTSQIKRAVTSVVSNIAEGCGKKTDKDFVRYLYNSLGSTKEVKCQLMIALRRNFLKREDALRLIDDVDKLSAMIAKFIKGIELKGLEEER